MDRRVAVAFAALCANPFGRLSGQAEPQNAGALFLLFPVGAQSVGMGQTAATVDGSGEAVFLNPAGVGSLTSGEFDLHSARLTAGNTTAVTAFFPRRGIGVFGAGVELVDYGEVPVTTSEGQTIGLAAFRNLALLATFATQLTGAVSLGVTYKLIQLRADCTGDCRQFPEGQGVTHALDLGGQFTIGPDRALHVGVALRNLGFALQVNNKDQADPLPTRLVVGASYRLMLRPAAIEGTDEVDRFDVKVAADLESPWKETGAPDVRVGVDVGYRDALRVRGGYAFVHEGLAGPSVGLGVAKGSIGVDLARMFLTGTDLIVSNPTFLSFRVQF
ncbi:MAG TPA: PorV/PorQ family protein [Gemmatimonadales bacterium]|jgi:hypothetical protein